MPNGVENYDTRGLSQRELILEIRDKQEKLSEKLEKFGESISVRIAKAEEGIGNRITRAELLGWLTGLGILFGIVFRIMGQG